MSLQFLFILLLVGCFLGMIKNSIVSNPRIDHSCRIHLPKLFLGMEHSRLNNWRLAQEFLQVALDTCPSDPQLYNEIGVVSYECGEYVVM